MLGLFERRSYCDDESSGLRGRTTVVDFSFDANETGFHAIELCLNTGGNVDRHDVLDLPEDTDVPRELNP